MQTLTLSGLTVRIGRKRFPLASLAQASEAFCATRDAAGTGASKTPTPIIEDAYGRTVAYVSYNGRVWSGIPSEWHSGSKPLYCPRAA